MSDSLWPHGLQHATLPCPSLPPWVCRSSYPLSMMPSNCLILCHPVLLQPSIFPSVRVFSNESVLCIRCQSIGASASALVLPMDIRDWFPLGLTVLISLLSKEFSRVFSSISVWKDQFFSIQLSLRSNFSHLYMTTGKTIALTYMDLCPKSDVSNFLICCLGLT